MATLSFGGEEIPCAGARVDGGGFDDNSTILDEFFDVGPGVGISDLGLFSGVEPGFSLADASGKAFLRPEID